MKKIAFLIILTIGILSQSFAQTINDAGLWCTFNVEKKLTQKFGVFLTEEYRLKENFSRNNLFYTDLGLFYKPFDLIKVSLSYRCIEKFQLDKSISFRHRIMLDVLLKKKVEKFVLSFRQRLQTEYRNVYSSELGSIPEWYTRSKLTVKYDLDKPITPYVAVELRYQINNPRSVEVNKLWHRARYIAGLDYKRNDKHTFGVYYLIQREWNVSSPQNLYIVGLEYSLSL
jgi:hypothetical protein